MNPSSQRAPYIAQVTDFLQADANAIVGQLSLAAQGEVTGEQNKAWREQVHMLQVALQGIERATVCFEFTIPRMGRRADNIVLLDKAVVVVEFKVGASQHLAQDQIQALDYALDLKHFHLGSHGASIVPVLVATESDAPPYALQPSHDGVHPTLLANRKRLAELFKHLSAPSAAPYLDHTQWLQAGYRPTPTIVEASQALYRGHGVSEITHSEAGADNLGATTNALTAAIDDARTNGHKVICFVTGVPGAGKTLAGLNLVCQRRAHDERTMEHAVFLSGNGPLVDVLREALARDEVAQAKAAKKTTTKEQARRKAKTFIQNIHHFRDDSLAHQAAPAERVVVFDEAQRAWNREQASKFMRGKRDQADFDQSEPDFLIEVMDRHPGWAAIVCLVGGGQEINTGEAGIEEWLRALAHKFSHWKVLIPAQLDAQDYLPTFRLDSLKNPPTRIPALHLGVSLRSYRAERLSKAIGALMTADANAASAELVEVLKTYPIVCTRSVEKAKQWLKTNARGSQRYGVLASSGAKRLKPLGFNMGVKIEPCSWFLNDANDVRSSYYLEDAASEFDVQGLELDWAMLIWDGDLIHSANGWVFQNFSGTRWQSIRNPQDQRYRLNAYRVLLTRARQGMVIVVPEASIDDPTRRAQNYDPTWHFLLRAGIPSLDPA